MRLWDLVLDVRPIPEPFDFQALPGELWVLGGRWIRDGAN